ncbi:unnamed protein product [Paramecium sonneborni]|uniref:Transmembrane protein n=1 Tax=Paramecium sonneborni TaxID=65129 RepID=A0A8S1R0K1_9CILI|nr:unnamed protein product [Paramecium sonneborni]
MMNKRTLQNSFIKTINFCLIQILYNVEQQRSNDQVINLSLILIIILTNIQQLLIPINVIQEMNRLKQDHFVLDKFKKGYQRPYFNNNQIKNGIIMKKIVLKDGNLMIILVLQEIIEHFVNYVILKIQEERDHQYLIPLNTYFILQQIHIPKK